MLPNPPSLRELAKRYGVSHTAIGRLRIQLRGKDPEAKRQSGAEVEGLYRRRLRSALPVKERVELLASIARLGRADPNSSFRAICRIDELEGVLTEKDKAARKEPPAPAPAGPVFILPPGTAVAMVPIGSLGGLTESAPMLRSGDRPNGGD